MSAETIFPHQTYGDQPPKAPHYLLAPAPGPAVGSPEFQRRMRKVGDALRAAGVSDIYLVHGTFVGPDAMGLLSELSRVMPGGSRVMQRLLKRVIDRITGEAGNYTPGYARLFEQAINPPDGPQIAVRLFHWSSENHHLGRADGAVRLIDELAALESPPGGRALLWGHSHAGNVFALVSNLLSGNRTAIDRFFEATDIYYRWPLVGCVDIPVWSRVRDLLNQDPRPLGGLPLDFVTFGTPLRYGWDAAGYSRLLHFIHHRPAEGLPDYRAPFPPKLNRVLAAADGDYVQQLGIAGTDTTPSILAWRAWMAENRLSRLLQHERAGGNPLERFLPGAIVPDAGTTLLVDYGLPDGRITRHLAGHAVYTRKRWMLFHAEETVRRLYGD